MSDDFDQIAKRAYERRAQLEIQAREIAERLWKKGGARAVDVADAILETVNDKPLHIAIDTRNDSSVEQTLNGMADSFRRFKRHAAEVFAEEQAWEKREFPTGCLQAFAYAAKLAELDGSSYV